MTAARQSSVPMAAPVHVAGRGAGIAAAQAVLAENGIAFSAGQGPERGAAPVVMLGEQALHLLDGLFGAGHVAGSHRITQRIVLWNEAEAVAIPHRAVAISGLDLLRALPSTQSAPRPAPPPCAGPAQQRSGGQDWPARSQRPDLPLAHGPSGRAGLSFLRGEGEPGFSLLRRSLRACLSGATAAWPSPPASADAVWWSARPLKPAAGFIVCLP